MSTSGITGPRTVGYWLLFCAFCNWAGWTLSAFGWLGAGGYAISFAVGLGAVLVWLRTTGRLKWRRPSSRKFRKRFTRLCPGIFLIFAALSFLSGALYPANYYDALAYRVPRVMHWLAAGQLHWIHTAFQRLNARGCGYEWVSAPIIALTRSDRPLFLISFVSYCLLPGLTYGCLSRLGVSRRVAYRWMWLLPLAPCFLLQAGTLGNDMFAAVFVLAGVYYSLRAWHGRRIQDFWMALFAAGLASGVKANTIPLLLAWVVILAHCWRLILSHWVATLVIGLLALACSFAPTALLNFKNCGDWTGAAAEHLQFQAQRRWVRPVGNAGILLLYNLSPPVNPFAIMWNRQIATRIGSESLRNAFKESFMTDGDLFTMEELQTDNSGLGVGIGAMLFISTASAFGARRKMHHNGKQHDRKFSFTRCFGNAEVRMRNMVFGAAWLGFLVMMETSFVKSLPRLLCPYYILLVTPLLLPAGHVLIVSRRTWRMGAVAVAILAAIPLVIRPERPLVPIRPLLGAIRKAGGNGPLTTRAEQVFSVYSQRGRAFAPVLAALPAETRVLGMITYDDPESTLWKPFGVRRIIHICPEDTGQELRVRGIRYVLVGQMRFRQIFSESFDHWIARMDAEVVQTLSLNLRAADGPSPWCIVRLR